jgi:radical SAM-linked protein
MLKRRLLFTKTGRAKFLSHLDLMRTFQRAFLRADIRLRHTEGFNPHPVMSFALPLSVGTESSCELLDFQLDGDSEPDGLPDRLGRALPEGIGVLEVYEPMRKFSKSSGWRSGDASIMTGACRTARPGRFANYSVEKNSS